MALSKPLRDKVLKRDESRCWHCGETEAISIQHRKNKQMGGSKSLDGLDNLIVLCSKMNLLIESDADKASLAKEMGWKLSSWDQTISPVFDANINQWFQLTSKGAKHPCDAPLYLI